MEKEKCVVDLSSVRQIKILENEITVNSLLDKDWILLGITNNAKEVAYHLGLVPEIRKKIDALEGRDQEQGLSIFVSYETLLNEDERNNLIKEIETLIMREQKYKYGLHLMISSIK